MFFNSFLSLFYEEIQTILYPYPQGQDKAWVNEWINERKVKIK